MFEPTFRINFYCFVPEDEDNFEDSTNFMYWFFIEENHKVKVRRIEYEWGDWKDDTDITFEFDTMEKTKEWFIKDLKENPMLINKDVSLFTDDAGKIDIDYLITLFNNLSVL
jgi:hypothetical protein